jgi:hypothetical protein
MAPANAPARGEDVDDAFHARPTGIEELGRRVQMKQIRAVIGLAFVSGALAMFGASHIASPAFAAAPAAQGPFAQRMNDLEARVAALESQPKPQYINPGPPPTHIVSPSVQEQLISLANEVKALQGQTASLQSQINNVWSSVQATAQQLSGNTNNVMTAVQTLQTQFASHTHNVYINHPGVWCSGIDTFSLTSAAGVHENVPLQYGRPCGGNNNTGTTPAWTETDRSSPPN